jgi:hypothetical protein
MKNIYHHRLHLPTELQVYPIEHSANVGEHPLCTSKIAYGSSLPNSWALSPDSVNNNLSDWLSSRGLFVHAVQVFYTTPFGTAHPHIDAPSKIDTAITNYTKLNWMKSGEGSLMDWYELKPNTSLYSDTNYTVEATPGSTPLVQGYKIAKLNDIVRTYSATIGTPSLVNTGRLHGIRNLDEPRYVTCVVVKQKSTLCRLEWDDAIELFADCIKTGGLRG